MLFKDSDDNKTYYVTTLKTTDDNELLVNSYLCDKGTK